ncbi:MAG: hypothetical protein ABWZ17_03980 [Candidatus Binatia bacterium]
MKEARKWVDDRLREGKTTETSSADPGSVNEPKNALAEPDEGAGSEGRTDPHTTSARVEHAARPCRLGDR